MTVFPSRQRVAVLVGCAVGFVVGVNLVRSIRPLLLLDADPAWALPRLLLGLLAIAAAGSAGVIAAAGFLLWSATRSARVPPAPVPLHRRALSLLAFGAFAVGALLRFLWLEREPVSLWLEDLTLIDPVRELRGTWTDFADAIRPAPSGVTPSYGSVGVLFLQVWRISFLLFGPTVSGIRFLAAAAGVLSLVTAAFLGRAILPRGGGTLVVLVLAGMRWHLILSRWAWTLALAPIVDLSALLLLTACRRRRRGFAVAAGLILGLGAHIYLSAWIALAALVVFALWPTERAAAGRTRTRIALFFLCGFAIATAPLFLLREGRVSPYFARTENQSLIREVRRSGSLLPVFTTAADGLAAPWFLPDPSPWQDVPKSRLGWLLGVPVALAFGRALVSAREELSALLLAHAGVALLAFIASGSAMQPNGYRFGYLTTWTAVAAAAGVLSLLSLARSEVARPLALFLLGGVCVSGAFAARDVFTRWAPSLEILDGFQGYNNLLGRTARRWEVYGPVVLDRRLPYHPRDVENVRRVLRSSSGVDPLSSPASAPKMSFRVVPVGVSPEPGERSIERLPDEKGAPFAVVLARKR